MRFLHRHKITANEKTVLIAEPETITQIVCPFPGGNTISKSGDLDLEIARVCQSSFKRAVGRTVADR